jgi:hypothetical protein
MDANGQNQHEVYDLGEAQNDALPWSWSPDGRYLAFTRITFTIIMSHNPARLWCEAQCHFQDYLA